MSDTRDLLELLPDFELEDTRQAPSINWGIIGAGGIADRFATAVRDFTSARVVAVGSRNQERGDAFATKFEIPTVHTDYQDLVSDPNVDVVYVATPHSFHRDHALLALEAGKHVMVEKPFTQNGVQAREIVELAQRKGLFVMEAMKTRHAPHTLVLHELIKRGKLGDLVGGQADHSQMLTHVPRLVDPNLAGGALLDLGIYPLSVLVDVFGLPEQIYAVGKLTEAGVDLQVSATLDYPTAQAQMTTCMNGFGTNMATFWGTEGAVWVDDRFFNPSRMLFRDRSGNEWEFDGRAPNGMQYEIAHAARCITDGLLESPRLPLQESVDIVDLLDDIRRQVGVIYPNEPNSLHTT